MKDVISKEKQEAINKINEVIELNGSFTTKDVEASFAPVIEGSKTHFVSAERFYKGYCEGVTYENNTQTDYDDYYYDDLDEYVLFDILELVMQWDAICYKTQKRIQD